MAMEVVNVSEYEALAKQKLPKMVFDYYASGAEDQWTLKENRNAFERIRFRPRILVDVSNVDLSTTVLGFKISMPIMIAPTAMQKMAHPEGELATARAASAAGTIMTLSSWATSSVEEVAATGPGVRFFQLYGEKKSLDDEFKMKGHGSLHYYLGIEVWRLEPMIFLKHNFKSEELCWELNVISPSLREGVKSPLWNISCSCFVCQKQRCHIGTPKRQLGVIKIFSSVKSFFKALVVSI